MAYQPGDVVLCRFPYQDNPTQFKDRPALVLKAINGGTTYAIAQITSTDKTGQYPGKFIKATSPEGKAMKLRGDSFVNLSNIQNLPAFAIHRYIRSMPNHW